MVVAEDGSKAPPSSDPVPRFEALDSLRGVCALLVALFHFKTDGYISNLPFVQNGWLFVDFFFVLSGFVIAHAYGERLASRQVSVARFMALRMGRIYPLHIVVLAAMVVMELVLLTVGGGGATNRKPFAEGHSLPSLLNTVFLLNCFDLDGEPSWNVPSWSIAAEMWTYLLFALMFGALGRRARGVFLLAGLLALLFLVNYSWSYLNTSHQYGFVRAVFGFSLGVGVQYLFDRGFRLGGTAAEVAIVLVCLVYVSVAGSERLTYGAPFLFALTVWIFAAERGWLSRLLRTRPMALIGTVSYSLYMIHAFVQARIGDVIDAGGARFGIRFDQVRLNPDFAIKTIVAPPMIADLLSILMLVLVMFLSILSYRWVEHPCREWTRAMVNRQRLQRV